MESAQTDIENKLPQVEMSELDRQKVLAKMKWGPLLNGISSICIMFGGPILGAGLMALIGIGSTAATALAWPLLIAGAVLSLTSIALNYYSSRNFQETGFDQMDVGAKTKAKCMVKELESHGLVIVPKDTIALPENESRKDGKSWVAATAPAESTVAVQR